MDQNQKGGFNFANFYSRYGMFAILFIIVVASSFLSDRFLQVSNILNVLRTAAPTGIAALGMTYILILGHIDLSVGSVMALTGCIACMLNKSTETVWVGLLVAVLLGALFGLVNSTIITTCRIPAFIVTMGTQYVARGVALLITDAFPVSGMTSTFKELGAGYIIEGVPTPIVVMIICYALGFVVLNKTKFGRYVFATGGNELAAKASGINTKAITIKSYVLHGALVGFAGVMLMSRMNSGQPNGALNYEFYAITAAVVGGTSLIGGVGNCLGTLTGALIVAILDNIQLLCGVNTYWQQIIKGTVIVLAVIADFKTKAALRKS